MPAEYVELILVLRQLREFISGTEAAAKGTANVGTQAELAGKKAQLGWKGIAKWAAGATVIYGAQRFIRGAVDATTDLAKSTLAVQRVTGMDTQTASEWVGVMKERNISSRQFSVSMTKLSKVLDAARGGTAKEKATIAGLNKEIAATRELGGKQAPAALTKLGAALDKARASGAKSREMLTRLGVPLDQITKGSTQQVLYRLSDAFKSLHDPVQRTALASQLFGRAGYALLPILMKGRQGIDELLNTQKQLGNYLSGKSIKDTQRLIQQQRDLHAAMEGIRVQVGLALVPVLTSLSRVIVGVAKALQPLLQHGHLVIAVVVVLTSAFLALKFAMFAATVADVLFNASLSITALLLGGAIIVAIIAVVAAVVLLYKRWKWFHDLVNATWRWIKANWPLLLAILVGPFGLAALVIARHFGTIKETAVEIVRTIKRVFLSLVDFFRRLPSRIGNWTKHLPGVGLLSKAGGALSHVPGFQHGGVTSRRGLALVGEGGPEIVALPGGAAIHPLPEPVGVGGSGLFNAAHIVTQLVVDRRVLAEAVGTYTADKLARR